MTPNPTDFSRLTARRLHGRERPVRDLVLGVVVVALVALFWMVGT